MPISDKICKVIVLPPSRPSLEFPCVYFQLVLAISH